MPSKIRIRRKPVVWGLILIALLATIISVGWDLLGPSGFATPQTLLEPLRESNTQYPRQVDRLRFKVMTLNIHHGKGSDGLVDLKRLAIIIADQDPDFVMLQELDRGVERSENQNQLMELAQLTGMHGQFGPAKAIGNGDYGNGILSKFPILDSEVTPLPHNRWREPRSVLSCRVEVSFGDQKRQFILLSTHLDFFPSAKYRILSAKKINRIANSNPSDGMLLAGDMNAVEDSSTLKAFRTTWRALSPNQQTPTYPAKDPQKQIDHVLCFGSHWNLRSCQTIEVGPATDHLGLLVELDWVESKRDSDSD